MPRPIVTLLTDFGLSDHYVAAMKGVILSICPEAALVDITHEGAPFHIFEAGYELAQAVKTFPPGTVHLVVVDPGVGSSRRPLLAEASGHRFVAPDNGVLTMALAGRAPTVREATATEYFRQPLSRTFHGRDIFAPIAAHLAAGADPAAFGPRIDDYKKLVIPVPAETSPGQWTGAVLRVDRFGNAITNFDWNTFHWLAERAFTMDAAGHRIDAFRNNYTEAAEGEVFVLRGSAGYLEISAQQRSAAAALGLRHGSPLRLTAQ